MPGLQRPAGPGRALCHSVSGSRSPVRKGGPGSKHEARVETSGSQLGSGMEKRRVSQALLQQCKNSSPFLLMCTPCQAPGSWFLGCRTGRTYTDTRPKGGKDITVSCSPIFPPQYIPDSFLRVGHICTHLFSGGQRGKPDILSPAR